MIPYRFLSLLLVAALAACSGKSAPPPAPAAPPAATTPPAPATASAPAAASASAAPSGSAADRTITVQKKASLDCDDRTIVVEATCSGEPDDVMLMCSRQSLTVAERATGAAKAVRAFAPYQDGDQTSPPAVEEKIGEVACIRSQTNERYILADMYNGGNCEACEWHDLYDWDGKLVATDRERGKPHAVLAELIRARVDRSDRIFGRRELVDLYAGKAR